VNRAIAWFASNHVAANLLMMVIVLGGLATMPTIVQELIPAIELDFISVGTPYPGASPSEVEASITSRVEEQLEGLAGVKQVSSVSAESMSSVTVELVAGEDVRRRLDDVRAAIDQIDTFPDDAEEPTIQQIEIGRKVLLVAVHGATDEFALKQVGQRVRDEIVALPEITEAELTIARDYEVTIEVSEASLRRFGLTFDDVVQAVRRSSLDLPGGSIKTNAGEILLRAKGQAYDGAEFERIALVSLRDGTRLTLGQVARVVDGFAESDQSARFDGEPTVMIRVSRAGNQKSLAISSAIYDYVDSAHGRLPEGISLTVWNDESSVLQDRLNTLLRNARGGFLLVVLILALFLRLRLAFWVSLGIPISFLGAVALMPHLDMTINFISLMAFIVVLGIVVDDAIVVGESTHTEQEKSGEKLRGAIRGAQRIVVPVTFGVLTTIAAFAPLLFIPGPMGRMTRVVPVIVICCLVFSLIESMFVLPAHLGHGRKPLAEGPTTPVSRTWKRFQDGVAEGLRTLIEDYYGPLLARALEWRYLTVAVALSLLVITSGLTLGGYLKFVFIEPVESDFILTQLTMAQGTPARITGEAIARIEAGLEAVRHEVDAERSEGPTVFTHVMSSVGMQPLGAGPGPRAGSARSASNIGEIQVDVVGFRERDVSVHELAHRWREKVGDIPGAVELDYKSSLVTAGAPLEVRLAGNDLHALRDAAESLKARLAGYTGVFDISDSFRGGKQELEYRILPSAEALGLTLQDLARQLRQAFHGDEAQSLQRGRDEVKVMVRYPLEERQSLTDVEQMRIRRADGTEVPFHRVAESQLSTGFSSIRHVDRQRVVTVTADVDPALANANEIVSDLRRGGLAELLEAYPGMVGSFEGEQAEQRDFVRAMQIGLASALFVIYVLLAIPLRSYLQPLIIMSAIPFGFVGAAWGHILLGRELTMYSVIGLVALSGVVVNASLVLVDYVNRLVADGHALEEAVCNAGQARFRAILLTSLTTFAGLTPMMLETSMQARFMIPMAISIAYGVVFSSFITLFLVPATYLVLEDILGFAKRVGRRGEPKGETTMAPITL
jgi:multidrug efflux pump subunit AcrB